MTIIKQTIKAVLKDQLMTDFEEVDFRLGECNKCEMLSKKGRCKICKCFVDVKAEMYSHFDLKALEYRITHCPLGKWNDKKIANYYRAIDNKELIS